MVNETWWGKLVSALFDKEGLLETFFKVLLPALIGVSIKVAIKMQREKITFLGVALSYVIGVSAAWLASPVINNAVSANYSPMVIAVVAITGDKIAEFIIYKWDLDGLLTKIFRYGGQFIVNLFTPKK